MNSLNRTVALLMLALAPLANSQQGRAPPSSPGGGGTSPHDPTGSSLVVRVVIGNELAGFVPAEDAVVTVLGLATPCQGSLVKRCSASGEARFSGVQGVVTVTAQLDLDIPETPGKFVRLATSLIEIQPSSGYLTVPLVVEGDDEADLSSHLIGTVTDIPPLGFGETLRLEVSTRSEGPDFNGSTSVDLDAKDPTLGYFGLSVPTGVELDLALVIAACNGAGCAPRKARLELGLPPVFGLEVLDLDWSDGPIVPFSLIPVAYSNVLTGVHVQDVHLTLEGPAREEVEISLFQGFPGFLPATLAVPPLSHPGLLGLRPSITVEQYENGTDNGASCTERQSATDFVFDMLGRPEFVPPLPAVLPVVDAATQTVSFVEGAGAQGNSHGLNTVAIESEQTGAVDVAAVVWSLVARPGTTSIDLPPTALPMFLNGAQYLVELDTTRFDVPVGFDALFGGQFELRFEDLLSSFGQESDATTHLEIQTAGAIPMHMLRLMCPSDEGINSWKTSTESGAASTLACVVERMNEIFLPATGVHFQFGSVITVPITAADLAPSSTPGNGSLSDDELIRLRNKLVNTPGLVPNGSIVLAPVGRFLNPLEAGAVAALDPDCSDVACLATHAPGTIDNLAFVAAIGDVQTFAHEIGHCFGLCHCPSTTANPTNMMVDVRQEVLGPQQVGPTTCRDPHSRYLCLSPEQRQKIQTTARDSAASLTPIPADLIPAMMACGRMSATPTAPPLPPDEEGGVPSVR